MVAARLYVPSLVTWWLRLRSLVLLLALSTLSFFSSALPQPDFLLYHRGIKPRVLSTSLSYPFFFHHSFSFFPPRPPPSLFILLLCKEQRDTQKTSTRSEPTPLLLDFHSVDRSFAHNGYKVTRSWRSLCSPSSFFFIYLRNPLSSSLSRRASPHGGHRFVPFVAY